MTKPETTPALEDLEPLSPPSHAQIFALTWLVEQLAVAHLIDRADPTGEAEAWKEEADQFAQRAIADGRKAVGNAVVREALDDTRDELQKLMESVVKLVDQRVLREMRGG